MRLFFLEVIENSVSLLKDKDGHTTGFCGLISDITKRKRLEEQLRENQERFEASSRMPTSSSSPPMRTASSND
jgi:PAS domain-containing protein